MIESPSTVSKHAVLRIEESAVGMKGLWPGRYGAVALLIFAHSASNVLKATLELGPLLKKMDEEGGRETTQALFEALHRKGVEKYPSGRRNLPLNVGKDAFVDGQEMFEILEIEALDTLGSFGGYYAKGPFVVSAKFFPEHIKTRMAHISSKFRPAEGSPDVSDFT